MWGLQTEQVSCLRLHASPEVVTINYKRNEVYEGILFPSENCTCVWIHGKCLFKNKKSLGHLYDSNQLCFQG